MATRDAKNDLRKKGIKGTQKLAGRTAREPEESKRLKQENREEGQSAHDRQIRESWRNAEELGDASSAPESGTVRGSEQDRMGRGRGGE